MGRYVLDPEIDLALSMGRFRLIECLAIITRREEAVEGDGQERLQRSQNEMNTLE